MRFPRRGPFPPGCLPRLGAPSIIAHDIHLTQRDRIKNSQHHDRYNHSSRRRLYGRAMRQMQQDDLARLRPARRCGHVPSARVRAMHLSPRLRMVQLEDQPYTSLASIQDRSSNSNLLA
ncbi:unnamed protein product [Jaminaea pallidilutea]